MISECERGKVWKNIEINDKAHIICFTRAENAESWKILLTDLVEIWVETLTHETMFDKCQTLNPLLTLEAFDWQQMVIDMLNDIPKHVVNASRHETAESQEFYRIKLQKVKDFIKLEFSLDFVKGTPRQFWENVTLPFCLSSMELLHQHEILLDLVKRKDEEIAEYKAEGAELIRKYIATKPFSEELFRTDIVASSATDFVKAFQSMSHFHSAVNLPKPCVKVESEVSLAGESDNVVNMEKDILPGSSRNELVQQTRQDESNKDEWSRSTNREETNPSTSKESILKLNSTSHTIQRSLKKNKKTLSDLIS